MLLQNHSIFQATIFLLLVLITAEVVSSETGHGSITNIQVPTNTNPPLLDQAPPDTTAASVNDTSVVVPSSSQLLPSSKSLSPTLSKLFNSQNAFALSTKLRDTAVDCTRRTTHLLNATASSPLLLTTRAFTTKSTEKLVESVKSYLSHRRSAATLGSRAYKIVGGILGILLSLVATRSLNWWSDVCLKERVASCGTVLTGSCSVGFAVGCELGSMTHCVANAYGERRRRRRSYVAGALDRFK